MPTIELPRAALTVDLEDYRQQYLRDYVGGDQPPYPREVFEQVSRMLEFFETQNVTATFFTVGRLAKELPPSIWTEITRRHQLGCHGYEHRYVSRYTREEFADDLARAKDALEAAAQVEVSAYRAPYFSADGCESWFFEVLAQTGFTMDSSVRLSQLPADHHESYEVETQFGKLLEVPLASLGVSQKRVTVIGGTYFRLFPLSTIHYLMEKARRLHFLPMLYLHPYDIDEKAAPIRYPLTKVLPIAADRMRRTGRRFAKEKLKDLFSHYQFVSLKASCAPSMGVSRSLTFENHERTT